MQCVRSGSWSDHRTYFLTGSFILRRAFRRKLAHQNDLPAQGKHRRIHLAVFSRHPEQQLSRGTRHRGPARLLAIDGPIADNGSAKLTANGIVASRDYARGVFAHQGESYSYDIKAQFKNTTGTGTREQGLGIVGRPCTFEFTKQLPTSAPGAPQPASPRPLVRKFGENKDPARQAVLRHLDI